MRKPTLKKALHIIGAFILLTNTSNTFSQGSSCAGASSLTSAASCTNSGFTISNGNSGTGSSSCVSSINDDAWYQFTATGLISNITLTGASNNVAVVVYSGTCAGLTEIGCDDQGTTSAAATASTTIGSIYYVRIIRTNNGGGSTTGNICVVGLTNMVTNGDFTSGVTSWTDCGNSTEIMATSQWHGGVFPYTPNNFAEVDAHLDYIVGNTDDMAICQNISGFTIGSPYTICMDVQRRPGPSDCTNSYNQPGTVTSTIMMDNGALSTTTSQSNTTWGWTNVCFNFNATSTTQLLSITPNDGSTCGMLITNIVVSPVVSLPVELAQFNAVSVGGYVELNWITITEKNNDYFIVQRSRDGKVWEDITEVDGVGNSLVEQDYESIDRNPFLGTSYYRLKQTDFDGTITYSNTKSVNVEFDYSIYPNPSNGEISIEVDHDKLWSFEVYSLIGEKVLGEEGISVNETKISLPEESGMYTIKIIVGDNYFHERVIKL